MNDLIINIIITTEFEIATWVERAVSIVEVVVCSRSSQ